MTIIAVRGRTMACDSCWATNGIVDVLANKIQRLPSGGLLGQSGDNDVRGIIKLLSNVKNGKGMPSRADILATRESGDMLLLLPNAELWKIGATHKLVELADDEDLGVWRIVGFPYACVGSGADVGLGALAMGATPAQAVNAAIKHQVNCRGPVYTASLLKGKK